MTDTKKSSDPITIPPPNNERTAWFGWGNSFYTPNKKTTENIVSLSDDDILESSTDNDKLESSTDTDTDTDNDTSSDTESNYEPFEEDISKESAARQFRELLMSKNKCQRFREFIVNAPDIVVVWGLLAVGCIFKSPLGYLLSMSWYAVEKDKHQKQHLNNCEPCNKWSDECYCSKPTENIEKLDKQDKQDKQD